MKTRFFFFLKILSLLIILLSFSVAKAENSIENSRIISGIVIDKATKKPIPSATIRIVGTNKGTICSKNGTFKLPKKNFLQKSDIKITSIGYFEKILELDLRQDSVTIFLEQNPVLMKSALVIGEISADEIIKRAIQKRDENRDKINKMKGLLYSKISLDMKKMTQDFNISSNGNTATIAIDFSDDKEKNAELQKQMMQGIVAETFSERYFDKEKNLDKTIIVNRRQTANFPQQANIFALEKFIDFSQDEIDFLDAKLLTPLNSKAHSYYNFELLERKMYENKFVYLINVTPKTSVYPLFEGTISIIEENYQLIEINLKPTSETKIFGIENIEFQEKFENIKQILVENSENQAEKVATFNEKSDENFWYPTYSNINAEVKIKAVPFLPAIDFKINTTAIVSDISINSPLPDSVYREDFGKEIVNIGQNVDSLNSEFWEENALIALTDEEKQMYQEIDSAAKELEIDVNADSLSFSKLNSPKKFSFSLFPIFDYNRVKSISAGLNPKFIWNKDTNNSNANKNYPFLLFDGDIYHSFGQHRWFGNAKIQQNNLLFSSKAANNYLNFGIEAGIFSRIDAFGHSFNPPNFLVNALTTLVFHEDYFDYYRKDGWNVALVFNNKFFDFAINYEQNQVMSLEKSTDKSLFSKKEFRENPKPETGNFKLIDFEIKSSAFQDLNYLLTDDFQYKYRINYQFGFRNGALEFDKSDFYQLKGYASIQFPIFETGYGNALLLLSLAGGIAKNNSPVQKLFLIEQSSIFSNLFLSTDNSFVTSYETYIGGTEFYSYHLRLNLRDWWWRMLRLPRIKGRGLDLFLTGTAGRYFNKGTTELSALYSGTPHGFYSEIGVGLGRIPIPGTDLFLWSIETRFGVGNYASGQFGFLLNFNLPF